MASEEQFKMIEKKAKEGDAEAQFSLGLIYAKGDGVAQDYLKAMKWLKKAAEQNHIKALFNLGLIHLYGAGVPKSEAEAATWFRYAAEGGYAKAQVKLGLMYRDGIGVPQDVPEAKKWLKMAVDQGYTIGMSPKKLAKKPKTPTFKEYYYQPKKIFVEVPSSNELILLQENRRTIEIDGVMVDKDGPHFPADKKHAHAKLPGGCEIAWDIACQRKHPNKFPAVVPKRYKTAVAKALNVDETMLECSLVHNGSEEYILIEVRGDN